VSLGRKVRKLRKDAGLSQEELAQRLFVSRQVISKWERDRGTPDIQNLQIIANLFNVSVDSLLGDDEHHAAPIARTPITIADWDAEGKLRGKFDAAVRHHFPDAVIHPLVRGKKLTLFEKIVDLFALSPGAIETVDSVNNLSSPWYLVERENKQLLVQVTREHIESRELTERFDGRKKLIDGSSEFGV